MKVTFDENGYVNGWCMVGDNGGEEYDPPEEFDAFLDNCFCFKLVDGKLVHDQKKEEADMQEQEQADLRLLREKECFSVVNRGWIWYSTLTLAQWRELRSWYIAWLKVTETGVIPERPSWVDDIDTSRIPLTLGGLF
ncbi:MAG: hypothetical protein IJQ02_04650 [Oscillospiraceae bacterium]|nr:hypothetical protein [Oscillospiraceae bacterium]